MKYIVIVSSLLMVALMFSLTTQAGTFKDDFNDGNFDGWNIIEVNYLLSLYKNVHSSDNCFAVKAASYLMKKGISPIHREELTQESKEYE